ncbi:MULTISPECIES: hypothetical protein [unclassified Streptomyces]|uniref:hypothetical protein n=1 Tax=unclassified Streptomyces TaxID=2593676 RepID=UPI00081EA70D|nr:MULTISPECIES: hypothetical protein [unclassified Streptomyces]MYR30539.1 hypothetical protein [Streptomyces sp. SID4945]SCF50066.1 hypothetical protein GA0115257_123716 [Streptomyces sp. LcepLS]
MADFTTRTTQVTHHDWLIPTSGSNGAPDLKVTATLAAAELAYRAANNLGPDALIRYGALTFHVEDDQLVIRFTTEELR